MKINYELIWLLLTEGESFEWCASKLLGACESQPTGKVAQSEKTKRKQKVPPLAIYKKKEGALFLLSTPRETMALVLTHVKKANRPTRCLTITFMQPISSSNYLAVL